MTASAELAAKAAGIIERQMASAMNIAKSFFIVIKSFLSR